MIGLVFLHNFTQTHYFCEVNRLTIWHRWKPISRVTYRCLARLPRLVFQTLQVPQHTGACKGVQRTDWGQLSITLSHQLRPKQCFSKYSKKFCCQLCEQLFLSLICSVCCYLVFGECDNRNLNPLSMIN